MQKTLTALLFVIIATHPTSGIQTQVCSSQTGPAGITECVKFQEYDGYQWSTCLSNSYIDNKSAGRYFCRFNQASYCWYQCQLEIFGQLTGRVKNPCQCTPGDKKFFNTSITLSSWCYSPPGDSCSWYKDCLEKRFQCSGTKYGYAIDYGARFCEEYAKDYQHFSTIGRKWVDGVRKCLQVALVPHLRDFYENTTCKGIKDVALRSYKCCYTAKSECVLPDTPSICKIPCMDWLRVAWRIKEAFVDEPVETASGIWQVVRQCPITSMAFSCTAQLSNYLKFLTMNLFIRQYRRRRSSDSLLNVDKENAASDLSKSISSQLNWNAKKVEWFVYVDFDKSTTNNLEVNFVFIDKNLKYWTPQHSNTTSSILDDLVHEMISKIESGNVTFATESEGVYIQLNKLSTCDGIRCDNKTSTIFPSNHIPPSTTTNTTTTPTTTRTTTAKKAATTTKAKAVTAAKTSNLPTITTGQTSFLNPRSGKRNDASTKYFGLNLSLIVLSLSLSILYLTNDHDHI